jgi:predicted O-methyltransferase YrrM
LSKVEYRRVPPADAEFEMVWLRCAEVPGWLTYAQALELWSAAREMNPDATIVEIGSHQGRSTIALGSGALVTRATVVAIDPFLEGRLFGGQPTRTLFEQNISQAELDHVVHLVPDFSERVLATWTSPVDLLYIDGKHDYWSCGKDIAWIRHMRPGSPVFIHDAFSSVGVTSRLLRETFRRRPRLRYRRRSGSLATFVVGRPTVSERIAVARQLPWFTRNLFFKILLRLRLRGLARALGHDSPHDPY